MKPTAVPSVFAWTKDIPLEDDEQEKIRPAVQKLEAVRVEQDEATDRASEGEGDLITVVNKMFVFPGKHKHLMMTCAVKKEWFVRISSQYHIFFPSVQQRRKR